MEVFLSRNMFLPNIPYEDRPSDPNIKLGRSTILVYLSLDRMGARPLEI